MARQLCYLNSKSPKSTRRSRADAQKIFSNNFFNPTRYNDSQLFSVLQSLVQVVERWRAGNPGVEGSDGLLTRQYTHGTSDKD